MSWHRVCILGVGLLGGSIGMRLRRDRLAREVVGYGRVADRLKRAVDLGAIDRGSTDCRDAAADSDLVIACAPVQQIVGLLRQAAESARSSALFTDVGSTKQSIVSTMDGTDLRSRFVGSHPIAGSDKSGVEFASPELFDGKLVVLTPGETSDPKTLAALEGFWRELGAKTRAMKADQHDEAVAITSHLPHMVASIVAMSTPTSMLDMTGTGWSDTTRVAAGNPQLWRQIIEENHGPVLRAMKNFATISQAWLAAVEAQDFERVEQLLIAGKEIRDIVGNRHSSG